MGICIFCNRHPGVVYYLGQSLIGPICDDCHRNELENAFQKTGYLSPYLLDYVRQGAAMSFVLKQRILDAEVRVITAISTLSSYTRQPLIDYALLHPGGEHQLLLPTRLRQADSAIKLTLNLDTARLTIEAVVVDTRTRLEQLVLSTARGFQLQVVRIDARVRQLLDIIEDVDEFVQYNHDLPFTPLP